MFVLEQGTTTTRMYRAWCYLDGLRAEGLVMTISPYYALVKFLKRRFDMAIPDAKKHFYTGNGGAVEMQSFMFYKDIYAEKKTCWAADAEEVKRQHPKMMFENCDPIFCLMDMTGKELLVQSHNVWGKAKSEKYLAPREIWAPHITHYYAAFSRLNKRKYTKRKLELLDYYENAGRKGMALSLRLSMLLKEAGAKYDQKIGDPLITKVLSQHYKKRHADNIGPQLTAIMWRLFGPEMSFDEGRLNVMENFARAYGLDPETTTLGELNYLWKHGLQKYQIAKDLDAGEFTMYFKNRRRKGFERDKYHHVKYRGT